jgi:hypothetical protein
MDLFVFDRSNDRVLTFVRKPLVSGIHCWEYAPQYADLFPAMKGWAFLFDYNCDTKPDLMTVNFRNNGISQYRNDSQGGNLAFTLVDSSILYVYNPPSSTNILASSLLVPDFNDIDGDGDMDILGQQFQCVGGFAYYRNMSMEHFGNCDTLNDYILETNTWGKFTLRSGSNDYISVGNWNVNCFQNPGPIFSYELARLDDTYASIRTVDLDGDNDKDALIGDSQAINSLYLVNGGTNLNATMVSQDTLFPSYNLPVRIRSFASHAFIDADNDGLKDLIVAQSEYENNRGMYFYKNTGTNQVPVYNHVLNDFLQNEMIDVGEAAAPVLYDYNGDGLKDLIIGNKVKTITDTTFTTGLSLYKNTGTLTSPVFEFVTDNYAGLQSLLIPGQLYPAFGDLDNDHDIDMLVGIDDGKLIYFMNIAGTGFNPVYAAPVYQYMSIDVNQGATPQLFDLDKDSLLDLLIGGKNGFVKYFENTGSLSSAFFSSTATNDTLGGIVVQVAGSPDGYSSVYAYDQGGSTRILVSCMKGDVYLYGNIDGNITGNFTMLDTVVSRVAGSRYGYNLTVSGGDLNNDSLADMVIGLYGGGVQIYYQDFTTSIHAIEKDFGSFISVYPNPASDLIYIESSAPENGMSCSLHDVTGRMILSKQLAGGGAVLDVANAAPGIYILKFSSPDGDAAKRVIINR